MPPKKKEQPAKDDQSKADNKKSKKDDLIMLAEEERMQRNRRIKERFLGALGIGVIVNMLEKKSGASKDGQSSSGKKGKKEKIADADDEGLTKKIQALTGPIMIIALIVGIFVLKAGENSFIPSGDYETNYYAVMGVPKDASLLDIKKAYKKLALEWHPDKNPDCTTCKEKFAVISEANEVLTDPDRRQAYDSNVKGKTKLQSAASISLTVDDFLEKVLRSNEIWIVQIYDPTHEASSHFHAVWEEIATKKAKVARFGRINLANNRRIIDLLPQRIMLTPAIFRFGRGIHPELFGMNREDDIVTDLMQFIDDTCPPMPVLESAQDVKTWQSLEKPRVLITGAPLDSLKIKTREKWKAGQHAAFAWGEFFEVKQVEARVAREALGRELVPDLSKWSVIVAGGKDDKLIPHEVSDVGDLSDVLHTDLEAAMTGRAPYITLRNYRQLCSVRGDAMKTYCLFMVDVADSEAAKLVKELQKSKETYHQEVADLKASSEEESEGTATDEPFRIQPVRITTSSSRFPWVPDCPDWGKFTSELWDHAGRSQMFLVEWDTRRFVPIKSKGLQETYQGIAYEDISFKELPEDGASLVTVLPDPESSLKAELRRILTSVFGAFAAVLLMAGAVAVFPELSLPVSGAITAGVVVLFLACSPAASRRFLAKLLMMY